MGRGRWSKWSNGQDECHALEFGFKFRFDVRGGPKTNGNTPDFWWASARDRSLGEFPTFEAAALACEVEARRLIETALANGTEDFDLKTVAEQWKAYLAHPRRLRSVRTRKRYK